jgi:hypothetical protein
MQEAIHKVINKIDDIKEKISNEEYLSLCNHILEIYKIYNNQESKESKEEIIQEIEEDEETCDCTEENFRCYEDHILCRNFFAITEYFPALLRKYSHLYPNIATKIKLPEDISYSHNNETMNSKYLKYIMQCSEHCEDRPDKLIFIISMLMFIIKNYIDKFNNKNFLKTVIDKIEETTDYYMSNINNENSIFDVRLSFYFDHTPQEIMTILNKWKDLLNEKKELQELMTIEII